MMNLLMKSLAKTLFLILAFSIVTFFTYPTYGEELSGVQKEVWKMQETSWELWKKGDVDGRLALYHKDCIVWLYYATFPGDKSLIKREVTGYVPIESFELEPQEVKVFGDVAIVQYNVGYTSKGKNYNERITTTWMNQDGKWQIIVSMRAPQPSKL